MHGFGERQPILRRARKAPWRLERGKQIAGGDGSRFAIAPLISDERARNASAQVFTLALVLQTLDQGVEFARRQLPEFGVAESEVEAGEGPELEPSEGGGSAPGLAVVGTEAPHWLQ